MIAADNSSSAAPRPSTTPGRRYRSGLAARQPAPEISSSWRRWWRRNVVDDERNLWPYGVDEPLADYLARKRREAEA